MTDMLMTDSSSNNSLQLSDDDILDLEIEKMLQELVPNEEPSSGDDSFLNPEKDEDSAPQSPISNPQTLSKPTEVNNSKLTKKRTSRVTRRPSPHIAFHPNLRILKRDIRRKYGEMMNNVFNSHDPALILHFLQDFTTPDCRAADVVPTEISAQSVFQNHFVQGIEAIITLFGSFYSFIPDLVMRLESVQVCKRSDQKGSRVVTKFNFQGTQVYDRNENDELVLRRNPKAIQLDGLFILHLDELHHIRVFEAQATRYWEAPLALSFH